MRPSAAPPASAVRRPPPPSNSPSSPGVPSRNQPWPAPSLSTVIEPGAAGAEIDAGHVGDVDVGGAHRRELLGARAGRGPALDRRLDQIIELGLAQHAVVDDDRMHRRGLAVAGAHIVEHRVDGAAPARIARNQLAAGGVLAVGRVGRQLRDQVGFPILAGRGARPASARQDEGRAQHARRRARFEPDGHAGSARAPLVRCWAEPAGKRDVDARAVLGAGIAGEVEAPGGRYLVEDDRVAIGRGEIVVGEGEAERSRCRRRRRRRSAPKARRTTEGRPDRARRLYCSGSSPRRAPALSLRHC